MTIESDEIIMENPKFVYDFSYHIYSNVTAISANQEENIIQHYI